LQELLLKPAAKQRPIADLNLGRDRRMGPSERLLTPAILSGYLNVMGSLDWVHGGSSADTLYSSSDGTILRLDFDSAVRVWGAVIENKGRYKSAYEAFLCPQPLNCNLAIDEGFRRQQTRVVYDLLKRDMRVIAGDNEGLGLGSQATPEFLGVSLEKAPAKLGTGAAVRPSTASTFHLDRRSEVEIKINGITYHRLQLQAGTYNIRDLPIATGASEIDLVVSDETGATKTLRLSAYSDTRLLRAGTDEWGIMAGLPSTMLAEERIYSDRGAFASGFYRRGLHDSVTMEAHGQADQDVAMGGGGVIAQTPWGTAALRGALSYASDGWGASAAFDWSMVNFRGVGGTTGHSFRMAGEFRTPEFATPGSVYSDSKGVLANTINYRARFDAFYSMPITPEISATLSLRYLLNPTLGSFFGGYRYAEDTYGADLTVARPLTQFSNIAMTVGYAKEPRWVDFGRSAQREGEVRGILNIRPDAQSNVSIAHDTTHGVSSVSAYRQGDSSLGKWHVTVNAQHTAESDSGSASGSTSLVGNRAEVTVTHGAGYLDGTYFGINGQPTQQRTSLKVGTAIAFADGAFAVSRPIRNGAFAIVEAHPSIAGKEIIVGDPERPRARSDWLGAAVVPDLPIYHPASVPIDVADLPIGYSLGAAAFDVNAPYKAGYRFEVGSAFSAYAYGTLILDSGAPTRLLSGIARSSRYPDRQVTIFTNGEGRFGAEGLAPGVWTIEVAASDRPTFYELTIPSGTDGLFDAGTLRPARSPQ
jgi:outer membrane usher protein